ncbi:hypothetical protein A9Q77_04850 [Marinomonas sp. 42_23_T18]|nr:hypothetical protein A9Q77_04850 [Marinomonas sp. 42_23_T18]
MVKKIKLSLMKNKQKGAVQLPLATSFTLFLAFISIMLGIGVCIAIFFPVDALVRDSRKDFINQEMQGVGRQITSFIEQRNSLLKDYVEFPVVTQTVMQPQANQGNIQDFLDDLSLLGSKVPLTLLDFSGQTIYSTGNNNNDYEYLYQSPPNPDKDLVLKLVFNPINQAYDWQIIRPILYQGYAEGFLVAEIPMEMLVNAVGLKESSENHRIQIRDNNTTFFDIGLQDRPLESNIPLKSLGLILSYNSDETNLREGREQLIFELIASLFLFLVLSLLAANFFGRRYLIYPLEKLRLFAHDLAEGKSIQMVESQHRFSEISDLERYFKDMVNKVVNREQSLQEAKKQLEGLNTQLVNQQQQLVHSEKLASVGHLAAGVAHEINNPAAYVKGNMEVLKDYKTSIQQVIGAYEILENEIDNADNPSLKDLVTSIQALKKDQDLEFVLEDIDELLRDSLYGMERIQKIVLDLKSFSRVDDSDRTLVDINQDVIEIALRLVGNELKYKCNISLDLKALPKLNCYPGELSQVIMNLLINARDAIHEKGEISISSECIDDVIQIKVSDTGEGISEANMLKLFDPFFTTKEVGKGTGLGLSISIDIVEKHGGKMTVSSQPGKGSCFTIVLPLVNPSDTDASCANPSTKPASQA